jgi:hypothetical protein
VPATKQTRKKRKIQGHEQSMKRNKGGTNILSRNRNWP